MTENLCNLWNLSLVIQMLINHSIATLSCNAKRQYLITFQVSRYCLLALKSSTILLFKVQRQYVLILQVRKYCLLVLQRSIIVDISSSRCSCLIFTTYGEKNFLKSERICTILNATYCMQMWWNDWKKYMYCTIYTRVLTQKYLFTSVIWRSAAKNVAYHTCRISLILGRILSYTTFLILNLFLFYFDENSTPSLKAPEDTAYFK